MKTKRQQTIPWFKHLQFPAALTRSCLGACLIVLGSAGTVAQAGPGNGWMQADYHHVRHDEGGYHSQPAHRRYDKPHHRHRGHKNRHSQDQFVYGKVLRVKPIFETHLTQVPRQSCYQEQVRYRRNDSSTGTILGGIIGAAVGHELGHEKRNKQIGAVAGAVLGSSIGHDISKRGGSTGYRTEQRCDTVYEQRSDRVLTGYRVKYRYDGRVYRTKLDYDPGEYIKLKQNLRPVY